MYCTRCGAPVSPQNVVCPSCGATLPVSSEPIGPSEGRLAGHVHLLAIFWIVIGILWLIPAGILLALGSVALAIGPYGVPGAHIARVLGPLVMYSLGGFLIFIAVLCFAAGWGLLHLRRWARSLAIVLGVISLLHPPFGTALGIYTLWVLVSGDAGREYDRLAAAA